MSLRVIAIDWSGAKTGAPRKIWLAEVIDDCVTRLEAGRDRAQVEALLIDEASRDANLVIGLDFGFSLPAWYLREQGFATAPELWAHLAAGATEEWLRDCDAPFWGRPQKKRPAYDVERPFTRRCEDGSSAKSVFQIGGAGAVGTGSLRGMPMLHRLQAAGFRIWPFDDAGYPLVMEIYPRLLTGEVRKSNGEARAAYIEDWRCGNSSKRSRGDAQTRITVFDEPLGLARGSDDAFDALFSAIEMWRCREQFGALPPAADDTTRLEGAIWRPSSDSAHVTGGSARA